MKKVSISVLLCCFFLMGCNSVLSINADDYLKAVPKVPDNTMVGIWTGATGPYVNTIRINADGTGIHCYSWNTKNVVGKLVYDGKDIIMQSGEKLEVNSFNNQELNMTANYYMTAKYTFYKDDQLLRSSLFCSTNMN